MLKTKTFGELVDFSRPSSAEYIDENGNVQIVNANVPRFTYVGGEPQGIVFDSLFSETGEIIDIPLFNSDEGTWIFDGELYECIPLKNSGFSHVLNGIGKIVFTYSNGTGKCWANGEVLYTVENINPQKVTNIVTGGYAAVKHIQYENVAYPDSDAANVATGNFAISDIGSLECNYYINTYMANDEFGAPIRSNFTDIHTLSRPSPKNIWNRHGKLQEIPANEPAFDHDPSTLRISTQTINFNNLRYRDIVNLNYSGDQTFEIGQTVIVSDESDIDRYIGGEVTASEAGSVTFTVRDKAGTGIGSGWVTIRSLGLLVESVEATNINPWFIDIENLPVTAGLVSVSSALFPDGQSYYRDIITNLSSNRSYVYGTNLTDGVTYTLSSYSEPGDLDVVTHWNESPRVLSRFNVATGQVEYQAPGVNARMVPVPGGYRCISTFQAAGTAWNVGQDSSFGDGESSLKIGGIQVEEGNEATSPIYTNGSAVTRAADVATIENLDTAEWFGLNEGWTVILECTAARYPVDDFCFAMVLGSSDKNRAAFYFFDGKAFVQFRTGSIFAVSANYQPGDKIIFGASYDHATGTRVTAVNGTADSNILSMDFSGSKVILGNQFSTNQGGRFLISDIIFRKRALTAAELQELTS